MSVTPNGISTIYVQQKLTRAPTRNRTSIWRLGMVRPAMVINDLIFLLLFCCTFGWKSEQKCTTINKHD